MKQWMLILTAILWFGGCNGDNAYDGENGLRSAAASTGVQAALETIRANVIIAEANATVAAAAAMHSAAEALTQTRDAQRLAEAQAAFVTLMTAWKKTEAVYIAGALDSAMIDLPGEVDYFHVGNEDYRVQLDTIFESNGTLEIQLFRNSNKSINALEYTLFGSDHNATAQLARMTPRRAAASVIMAEALQEKMQSIADFYAADERLVGDGVDSVEALLNQLIDSAYGLKEWRVGDPAGLTVSYLDQPDTSLLEYVDSHRSLDAIRAILEAHAAVMEEGMLSISALGNASVEGLEVQADIVDALAAVDAFDASLAEQLESDETAALYAALKTLFDDYYVSLINALQLTTEILDADGD